VSPRPQIDHIRRPQLLAAAAEVIAERGFAQTRIADVAERAGTSAASVLYWFESRDKLLTEALSHAERSFHDEVSAELETIGSPAVQLATLIERSIGGDDWILWIELWARALRDPDVRESRRLLDESWREQIRSVVAEGQATGAFGGPDPERVALELASLIDGLAVQVALDDRQVSAEVMRVTCFEVAERLLEVELTVTSELAA
jgi:AcrR family transcriptional regulator